MYPAPLFTHLPKIFTQRDEMITVPAPLRARAAPGAGRISDP